MSPSQFEQYKEILKVNFGGIYVELKCPECGCRGAHFCSGKLLPEGYKEIYDNVRPGPEDGSIKS